jgi:hypothetical protein
MVSAGAVTRTKDLDEAATHAAMQRTQKAIAATPSAADSENERPS